jgi:hypothetical protein
MTTEQRAVLNAAFRIGSALGRKFEATDMTIELRQAAHLYAATYEGDFEYMVGMRQEVTGGRMFFSDGQSKGILNCLMADARKRLAAKPAPSVTSVTPSRAILADLPDGRYRVTPADGESIAVRVSKAGEDGKLKGSRIISTRINGDEWMGVADVAPSGDFRLWRSCHGALRGRITEAVNILDAAKAQDEWLVLGLAYAQEGSECCFCGRDLDTPESLTVGYGPTCADKHGLPWGARAIPMSVRLAAANIHPETGVEETPEELLQLAEDTRPTAQPRPTYMNADGTLNFGARKALGRDRTYQEIFGANG